MRTKLKLMAYQTVSFGVEVIDGYRLGRLRVPVAQVADWLNFLLTPHYRADIVSAEQEGDRLNLYFEASEGLYTYLENSLMGSLKIAA